MFDERWLWECRDENGISDEIHSQGWYGMNCYVPAYAGLGKQSIVNHVHDTAHSRGISVLLSSLRQMFRAWLC